MTEESTYDFGQREAAEMALDAYERWQLFPESFDPTPLYRAYNLAMFGDPED